MSALSITFITLSIIAFYGFMAGFTYTFAKRLEIEDIGLRVLASIFPPLGLPLLVAVWLFTPKSQKEIKTYPPPVTDGSYRNQDLLK